MCGVHKCQRLCHTGDCGQCIQAVTKACRCGKKTKSLVCFQEFFCESKCQKMRDCGNHMCKRKVHRNNHKPSCMTYFLRNSHLSSAVMAFAPPANKSVANSLAVGTISARRLVTEVIAIPVS